MYEPRSFLSEIFRHGEQSGKTSSPKETHQKMRGHSVHTPFLLGGGELNILPHFQKREGLTGPQL